MRQLVEDVPRNSYGSVSSYEQSHRHSVRYSSLGESNTPSLFLMFPSVFNNEKCALFVYFLHFCDFSLVLSVRMTLYCE